MDNDVLLALVSTELDLYDISVQEILHNNGIHPKILNIIVL